MDVVAWFTGLACILFGLLLLSYLGFLLVDTWNEEHE